METILARRAALLDWYRGARRDLPWRGVSDPYAIWVSEVMLQQTRVDTVRPYYARFLSRWPSVEALAAAPSDALEAAWSGLGYYRRLRLMQAAARTIVDEHGGVFPSEPAALSALPGFGRYTAGAVAAIAFDRPAAAVDGNVQRVLARVLGIDGDPSRGEASRRIWAVAEALAPGPSPGDLVQALIELGATLCSVRRPTCDACPLADPCVARREGRAEAIPPPRRRPEKRSVALTAVVGADADGRVWLLRQPESGLFGGLWCPPLLEGRLEPDAAVDELERSLGWSPARAEAVGRLTHVLTHRRLELEVVRVEGGAPSAPGPGLEAVPVEALESRGLPSLASKILDLGLPPAVRARARLPGRRRSPTTPRLL